MNAISRLFCVALVIAIAIGTGSPAEATTMIRLGLAELVSTHRSVVVGEVLDVSSHWNTDGTFILTDVRVLVLDTLKGQPANELSLTLMGGTVGDLTTLIVSNAELVPGKSYVLFLDQGELPGGLRALTPRALAQGVFELTERNGLVQAVSQAHDLPLLPDAFGETTPPGGSQGLPFTHLIETVRELSRASMPARQR